MKNDRKCQREFYEYCFPIMMRICKRYTDNEDEAVESMNTSFLKILKKLDTLHDFETIHGWIKQITVNTSIDFYRSKKRYLEKTRLTLDNEHSTVGHYQGSYDFTESRMDSVHIFALIQQLPVTTREVLNLFAIDGYSHREVADMLQISEESSRWHLHRARKLMAEKLEKQHETIKATS